MTAIQARKLTKHYGSFPALVDLDLDVEPGEVFGFLGPNGAGKSTTIRVLMGELNPTSGAATVLGAPPREVEHRRRLGYLPADLALWPAMTGKETLKFFANLRGGVDWGYVDQLIERLKATVDKRVGELSSGNRQKIGLIATFMHQPELLLLDEPNAGLDPLIQHEFWAMMREVADDGRTVFLSSHTLSEVERVADRVGIIRKGRLVAVEQMSVLRERHGQGADLEDIFLAYYQDEK
ncbi:MAG: ABC transporter ATP-binding protein [Propionibacteriaceae bacterium]|nr:ABC transporter ATP-binding protein [Propionibacteriaceae bacterium]